MLRCSVLPTLYRFEQHTLSEALRLVSRLKRKPSRPFALSSLLNEQECIHLYRSAAPQSLFSERWDESVWPHSYRAASLLVRITTSASSIFFFVKKQRAANLFSWYRSWVSACVIPLAFVVWSVLPVQLRAFFIQVRAGICFVGGVGFYMLVTIVLVENYPPTAYSKSFLACLRRSERAGRRLGKVGSLFRFLHQLL